MCRWNCSEDNQVHKCKYCGVRFCLACRNGDFTGQMFDYSTCRLCNQPRCVGEPVEKPTFRYAVKETEQKEGNEEKVDLEGGE